MNAKYAIYMYSAQLVQTVHANITLDMIGGRVPPWWRRVAFARTKQVYYASPELVVYIIPAQSILSRLALVPVC